MECCFRTGSFRRSVTSIWNQILATTKNWMPAGFIPKTAVWITAELACSAIAETSVPVLLQAGDALGEATIPFYRTIPLISAIVIPIIATLNYSKNSKQILSKALFISPIILYFYSIQDLETYASRSQEFIVLNLANIVASISGGYLGLMLTHSGQDWTDYRFQMVEHALAGRVFEACITPASTILFKIPRSALKFAFQATVYNRRALTDAAITSIRRSPNYGVITPILSRFFYGRFDTINRQNLANDLSKKALPFFSNRATAFFSAAITEPLLRKKIDELQAHSEDLVTILAKSLIDYGNLLSLPEISLATTSLFKLISINASEPLIQKAIEELEAHIAISVKGYTPRHSSGLHLLNDKIIWHKENLDSLAKLLSSQIDSIGVFLFGSPVYPKHHLRYMNTMIKIHLKPFTYFTLCRGMNLELAKTPLSNIEDIQLNAILHHAVFSALIHPLLPESATKGFYKTLQFIIRNATQTIHKLQGFKSSAIVYEKPKIQEEYIKTADPVGNQDLHARINIVEHHFVRQLSPPPSDSDDDYVDVGVASKS